jgi:topoisomerase-4 subunit A
MEIRREHESLTKEQKELKRLLGSEKLKDETLISQMRAIQEKFGGKRKDDKLGHRRTQFALMPDIAEEVAAIENYVEREPITVVCSEKGWLRSFKGHQEPSDAIKYREGDCGRFWLHAETTDRLMMLSTDGRFFTLDCAKLPGGRGNGEAIRTFIDLPPEADLVEMFVHEAGRKLLLAATSGHGFVTNEDDAVAMTRSGKRVLNVGEGARAQACAFVDGETVAVIGDNRKLLIFPLSEVPEMARGRGVILQRYKDGGLLDVTTFTWKQGLKDENNRLFEPAELKEWRGARAQAGRLVPRGWAKSVKFAPS